MKIKLYVYTWLVAFGTVFAAGRAQAQNLATNPGFESGNTGFTTQYTYLATGTTGNGAGTYTVRADESTYNTGFKKYNDHTSGDGTGLYLIVDGAGTANQYFWNQRITGLQASTTYKFSFWLINSNAGSLPTIQVSSSPTALGAFTNVGGVISNPNTTGLWQQYTVSIATTALTTELNIRMIDTNVTANSNDFGIDDISLLGPSAVAPTATSVTNSPAIVNTSGPTALTPNVSGTASGTGNSISTFTVFAPSAGALYYNGTQIASTAP